MNHHHHHRHLLGHKVTLLYALIVILGAFLLLGNSRNNSNNSRSSWQQQSSKGNQVERGVLHNVSLLSTDSNNEHVVLQWRRHSSKNNSNVPPPPVIPVMIWPLQDPAVQNNKKKRRDVETPDQLHILLNGVQESFFLTLYNETLLQDNPNTVWVTDVKFSYKVWCRRLHQKALSTQEDRRRRNNNNTNDNNLHLLPLQWPIFIVDFTDPPNYQNCPELEDAVGKEFVFYFKRSMAIHRQWRQNHNNNNNESSSWIEMGELLPKQVGHRYYEYTPLIVRTDIVQLMDQLLKNNYDNHQSSLMDDIETLPRNVDVAHYWPVPHQGKNTTSGMSNLRNRLSWLLQHHVANWPNNNNSNNNNNNYTVVTGLVGTADRVGRRKAQTAYVQAMLDTKIVVVGQRDLWEDHFRLYEALVSGAMVMTDPMIVLPRGLIDGISLVVFHNASHFLQLIRYYLNHPKERIQIARKGREAAMSYHRSWHRMEEIIFGTIINPCPPRTTTTTTTDSKHKCPYAVHNTITPLEDAPTR